MKKLISILLLMFASTMTGQNNPQPIPNGVKTPFIIPATAGKLGINTNSPQAALDITSTSNGILIPRLTTTQKNAISSPQTGELVFDTTIGGFQFYNGSAWTTVGGSTPSLDAVAAVGNSTSHSLTVESLSTGNAAALYDGYIFASEFSTSNSMGLFPNSLTFYHGGGANEYNIRPPTSFTNRTATFPDKSGTVAFTDDITAPTINAVLNAGNVVSGSTTLGFVNGNRSVVLDNYNVSTGYNLSGTNVSSVMVAGNIQIAYHTDSPLVDNLAYLNSNNLQVSTIDGTIGISPLGGLRFVHPFTTTVPSVDLKSDNTTTNGNVLQLPNGSGNLAKSVNGEPADSDGNITLDLTGTPQNLQSVTDNGATTTNPIYITDGSGQISYMNGTSIGVANDPITKTSGLSINEGLLLSTSGDGETYYIRSDYGNGEPDVVFQLPATSGTKVLPISVNGELPDTGGNIVLSLPNPIDYIVSTITDGDTFHSPDSNVVFDTFAEKQPLDSDLTTIAGLNSTTGGNLIMSNGGGWASTPPSTVKTNLNLVIGTDLQAYSTNLNSWSAINRYGGFDTFAATPTSANLLALMITKTGTGNLVFGTSPTFSNPIVGTQTANDNSTKAASTAYADAKVQNSLTASTTIAPSTTAVNNALNTAVPSQTGNNGKILTTNGTTTSWITNSSATIPSQTGNSGKFLSTDGTTTSWTDNDVTVKQDKSLAAYSFMANNTSGTANATSNTYTAKGKQTYTGTVNWTGTTSPVSPTGTTGHTYNWTQIGNMVTLNVNIVHATGGTNLTNVTFTLPSDAPTPVNPTSVTGNSIPWYYGSGKLFPIVSSGIANTVTLSTNSTNTGLEINCFSNVAGSFTTCNMTIQYFTN